MTSIRDNNIRLDWLGIDNKEEWDSFVEDCRTIERASKAPASGFLASGPSGDYFIIDHVEGNSVVIKYMDGTMATLTQPLELEK